MNDLDEQLDPLGTALFEMGERSKRADKVYRPRHPPRPGTKIWSPTLAVEIGYEEGKRKLATDARWWLTASNGEVKIGVTISINQIRRDITLQYLWWTPVDNQL